MGCEGRKVYVEVNVTHRADGSARPNCIYFENDERYEIDRVIQKCRADRSMIGKNGRQIHLRQQYSFLSV